MLHVCPCVHPALGGAETEVRHSVVTTVTVREHPLATPPRRRGRGKGSGAIVITIVTIDSVVIKVVIVIIVIIVVVIID